MFPQFTEECPNGMYEMTMEVGWDQVDSHGRMRIGDLARQMQILTERHYDRYSGSTMQALTDSGLSWIIAWSELQICRLPALGEQIRMRVWGAKKKAVMHVRKYAFYTMDGEPLVTTASLFVLMDQKTRQMAADPAGMEQTPVIRIPDEPNAPKMSMQFPDAYAQSLERTVAPEEIDYNGHMNNSHYLDWAECLPDEGYLGTHIPRRVWIEYTKELREEQKALLHYDIGSDILYVQGSCEGEPSFRIRLEYDAPAGLNIQKVG